MTEEQPPLTKKERMAIDRVVMPEQDPKLRAVNFAEVNEGLTYQLALLEAQRCLECPKEYCIAGCPVSVNIPRFIRFLRDGDVAAAANSLLADNALPCVTGRVCPQETQCELVCLRGKTGKPVAIGYLERYVADWAQAHADQLEHATATRTKKSVAVIGSGPAGLTAAGELVHRGHEVTIFEAFHAAGGVLIYGIPEFRLPKDIVQAEVDRLKEAGVKIEPNAIIGKTFTLPELREQFDAIFVAVGAGLPVFMGVPGENLKGVYSANEYLTRVNLMGAWNEEADTPILHGRRVAVVGGGNVAMDSVRTARRMGATQSTIVYRRGREELPARAEEVHHAEAEGIDFKFQVAPVEVIGDEQGWVTGLRCVEMTLGEPDASGPPSPAADPRLGVRPPLRHGGRRDRHPEQPAPHRQRAGPRGQRARLPADRCARHDLHAGRLCRRRHRARRRDRDPGHGRRKARGHGDRRVPERRLSASDEKPAVEPRHRSAAATA